MEDLENEIVQSLPNVLLEIVYGYATMLSISLFLRHKELINGCTIACNMVVDVNKDVDKDRSDSNVLTAFWKPTEDSLVGYANQPTWRHVMTGEVWFRVINSECEEVIRHANLHAPFSLRDRVLPSLNNPFPLRPFKLRDYFSLNMSHIDEGANVIVLNVNRSSPLLKQDLAFSTLYVVEIFLDSRVILLCGMPYYSISIMGAFRVEFLFNVLL